MNFQRSALTAVLLAFVLIPLSALAGNVDPLLRLFQNERQNKAAGSVYSHAFEKIVAWEDSGIPNDPRVGVLLSLTNGLPDLDDVPGIRVGSVRGSVATARLPLSSVDRLAATPGIEYIEAARMLYPTMDLAIPGGKVNQVWAGAPAYTGAGVLVGVIDTGIDWTHDDFKNADGTTRIKAIWDQYGTGTAPGGDFNYGAEYTESDINDANVAEKDLGGHGTHVAGIAAGNGRASGGTYKGVAFESDILFVKAYDDVEGGFPSDKTYDAIDYLVRKAAALDQPIAINMSLGGHRGPHDGSNLQESFIDQVSGEGVAICIAAGNEGSEYYHDSAAANGGTIRFYVQEDYTPNPQAGDDYAVMEIWVEQGTNVSVTSPGGTTVGPAGPDAASSGYSTPDGVVVISNALEGTNPVNNDQVIFVQLDDQQGTALAGGYWEVSFTGGVDQAHAWKSAATMWTGFPDSDHSYTVGMPGTAREAITVAAWKSRNSWPSINGLSSYDDPTDIGDRAPFSSIGRTRDGREKPDISAPGMAIISCYSKDTAAHPGNDYVLTGNKYFATQGTSMACPFTCGVAALLFEKNSELTSVEIKAALQNTATTDGYTGATWNAEFGAGKINAAAAIASIVGDVVPDGDVNLDGTTSVVDVILMVNHILAVGDPLTAEAAARANVNGDATVDVQDLVRVVGFILGTDTPGKSSWTGAPAVFAVGEPYEEDGRWWVEVSLSGEAVAAGQFALNSSGAGWDASSLKLDDPSVAHVAANVVGMDNEQIRVLVYDLDNELPSDGVTLRIPFEYTESRPAAPELAGLLVADSEGDSRQVVTENSAPIAAISLGVSPNPSSGATSIQFQLGANQSYSLAVYDLRGRKVRELEQGIGSDQTMAVGWDGRDGAGHILPTGMYFVRLVTGTDVFTEKVLLSR